MRDQATVYLLDPRNGYRLYRHGTSGVTCLVERTTWQENEFRDDIYIPLCYDAAGSKSFLKVIMDAETLRIQGMSAVALKAEIERRYKNKIYKAPDKAGLSYMIAPVIRTWRSSDKAVFTISMPHMMYYAPNITSGDIGAVPAFGPLYPSILEQGVPEQRYMIQLIGDAERAKVMSDEKTLIDDLCAYRDFLCLANEKR